jgi:NADPH2:quinone reductase
MKGIQVDHWLKGPDDMKVTEISVPEPKKGELLIQVKAVGLNFFDILMVSCSISMSR